MASIQESDAFTMKPDLTLNDETGVVFALDAKWKRIDPSDSPKHGIDQGDVYQLYAYATRYKCKVVALLFPRTHDFNRSLHYRIFDGRRLICLPFDVEDPAESVRMCLRTLQEHVT